MKKQEREFLEDIEDALGDWGYQTDAYHENEYFCVDVTICIFRRIPVQHFR